MARILLPPSTATPMIPISAMTHTATNTVTPPRSPNHPRPRVI
ncbi:hypothetical protein ACFQV4_25375 [Streptomyces thermocarboxydus]